MAVGTVCVRSPGIAAPSGNADSGVRLRPFLEQIDQLRSRVPEFARIGHAPFGTARRDLFLGTMADGRIKILISTEQDEVGGRGRLRWCVDSPSLNGHYQEFKTIWRPRLLLTPATRDSVSGDLLEEYRESRLPALGRVRANAWYIRQVAGVFFRVYAWLIVPFVALLGSCLSPSCVSLQMRCGFFTRIGCESLRA